MENLIDLLIVPFAAGFLALLGANIAITLLKLFRQDQAALRISKFFYPIASYVRLGGRSDHDGKGQHHA